MLRGGPLAPFLVKQCDSTHDGVRPIFGDGDSRVAPLVPFLDPMNGETQGPGRTVSYGLNNRFDFGPIGINPGFDSVLEDRGETRRAVSGVRADSPVVVDSNAQSRVVVPRVGAGITQVHPREAILLVCAVAERLVGRSATPTESDDGLGRNGDSVGTSEVREALDEIWPVRLAFDCRWLIHLAPLRVIDTSCLTFKLSRPRKRANPAVVGWLERLVGHDGSVAGLVALFHAA